MNSYIKTLASLKLTVILLILIAIALSIGTIIESLHGMEAARAVYYAPWFFSLQALFAVNIIGAVWERFPRNRYRIGFLITHVSMLLILGGAMATAIYAVEGRLPLWEGDSAARFLRAGPGGSEVDQPIPFSVRLDAYEMDYYPGTHRPAMFRSRVTVLDPAGKEQPAVIEMNKPLYYGGYAFFQSSYNIEGGREMSILSVSKDPGQVFVFWGYGLLVFGMLVVLVTRIFQSRAAAKPAAPMTARITLRGGGPARPAPGAKRAMWLGAGLLAAMAAAATPALAVDAPTAAQLEAIRRLPVQADGRAMAFDTQARDAVRTVTGSRSWKGLDPVAMAVNWSINPMKWMEEPVVKIDDDQIAVLAGRSRGIRYASYRTLIGSEKLSEAVNQAMMRQQGDQKPSPADKHLLKLEERIRVLDAFLRGEAILPIPAADPAAAWSAPPTEEISAAGLASIEARVRPTAPAHYPSAAAIAKEIKYNAVNPTRIAWFLLLPAAIAAWMTLERDRWRLRWVAGIGSVLGFAVMTWGIATRWDVAGRIPASNMYESMLFLGWGVGLFGVVSLLFRNRMLIFNAAAMSALVYFLLDRLPMDSFIRPMPPVLSGTPWLAIHVPIIMVSYSVFAIATFLSHVVLGVGIFAPAKRAVAAKWSELLYWYLMVGSILLIAGILTGSIWAASSWGRYWGWDPKEVWSLVAFLAYMAILHARFDGMIASFGVAVCSIAAFWTILMTYLGVNFVLSSGLHAYGAGSSNLVRIMSVILLVEVAFVLAAWRANRIARQG